VSATASIIDKTKEKIEKANENGRNWKSLNQQRFQRELLSALCE